MPSNTTVRALDVGYGNTKFIVDDRGSCRLFPSLAPRANAQAVRCEALPDRRTQVVQVDSQVFEIGADSTLFPDSPLLHRDYTEMPEYRALVYGALHAMQASRIDLLVTGLPVYLHHSRAQRLKKLLTGRHQVGERSIEVADVAVVAQPIGGLIAYSQESEDWSTTPERTRLIVDPGYFSLDWLVTRGLTEVPGLSHSIEGGVCEVLKGVQNELGRECGESYGNLRRLDEGLRLGSFQLRGQPIDLEPYRALAADVARRALRRLRNHIVSCLPDIEEIVLLGGGSVYFEAGIREEFSGCPLNTARDPVFANVRGFQLIGRMLKQRRASVAA